MSYKIWLPVNIKTEEVDYEFMSYHFKSKPKIPELIEAWEYREFAIVDLSKGLEGIIDEL